MSLQRPRTRPSPRSAFASPPWNVGLNQPGRFRHAGTCQPGEASGPCGLPLPFGVRSAAGTRRGGVLEAVCTGSASDIRRRSWVRGPRLVAGSLLALTACGDGGDGPGCADGGSLLFRSCRSATAAGAAGQGGVDRLDLAHGNRHGIHLFVESRSGTAGCPSRRKASWAASPADVQRPQGADRRAVPGGVLRAAGK
jgi:hypothetical protein